ncbi:glycosyl hydrolase family 18 protein [Eubacterium oxidoreducens]|uniref:Spore germination protein YaaH n=1 Tax=Eubacterium oxidoreducens TaxID=1732 RepID=A0A1G6A0B5_EUBOX|nr:glycosyl hydrolase family 18 protein [Eubacterium oxidoreducens]SDB01686.1 Spore germination protein YaaH [Eubacterium oxidoreducens]
MGRRKKAQRARKKKLLIALVIVVIVVIAALAFLVKKYTPTSETVDLNTYYNIEEEQDIALIIDREKNETLGKYINGEVYVPYDILQESINERFYWDSNEKILLYTTANEVIKANANEAAYTAGKEVIQTSYQVVMIEEDETYVALDFVEIYANVTHQAYESPNRAVITSKWETITQATAKKETPIRVKGGIKSKIVDTLEKDEVVTIIEGGENWTKVMTEDGMIGYMKNSLMSDTKEVTLANDFQEEEISHNLKDEKVNLLWHQVTNQSANNSISTVLARSSGINVISPTWFYMNDENGGIASIASLDYVQTCHENDVEVWALVSNLENTDIDCEKVLTTTSLRTNLVNSIMAAAIQYGLDGINLDFESLSTQGALGFVQLIRELSIKCRANDVILSVDNYVPSGYTTAYNRSEQAAFADYVVIMAYDEHYAGSDEGSVSSINYVTESVTNTLKEVPAEQIILGLPFYARLWEETPDEDAENGYTLSSTAVGMDEADTILEENDANKTWNEELQQYYAEYEADGKTYKIWMEEETSLEAKLKIYQENNLAGAAFWKSGFERSTIWDLVNKYVQ